MNTTSTLTTLSHDEQTVLWFALKARRQEYEEDLEGDEDNEFLQERLATVDGLLEKFYS